MYGGVTEWEKETSPDDQPMISDTSVLEIGMTSSINILYLVTDQSIITDTSVLKIGMTSSINILYLVTDQSIITDNLILVYLK